jgi:hypothetical protein
LGFSENNTLPPKGQKHTEETRVKMSIAHIGEKNSMYGKKGSFCGRKHTKEARKKMSEIKKGEKHPLFGKHHSAETRQKISLANMGRKRTEDARKKMSIARLGRKITEEWRKKISLGLLGCKRTEETRKKMSNAQLGRKHTEETKRKISLAKKGHKVSEEQRKKLSLANKGQKHTEETCRKIGLANKGLKRTEETRKKISVSRLGKWVGEKNSNWRGGSSRVPYAFEFDNKVKKAVFIRDDYTCQLCGKNHKLSVHHINCDKTDTRFSNLITLCSGCNGRVNFNRDFWTNIFHIEQLFRKNENIK